MTFDPSAPMRTRLSAGPASIPLDLLTLLALAACTGGDAPEEAVSTPATYMTHRNWGVLPPGREWGRVSGVDIDPNGTDVWVFERCGADDCITSKDPTVLRFSSGGSLLASFGADMFVRPHGMHVDDEGNVWVTDGRIARPAELEANPEAARKGNQVVKLSPTGEVLLVLGTPGTAGDPPAALDQPNDVVVAPNGEILVAEGHGSAGPGRISRFAADGAYLGSFGEYGSGPGQFAVPHALAFDSQGRLFVADRGNSRIQIFDSDYRFVAEWKQFGRPNDVFIEDDDDTMYVADSESGDERNPGMRRGIYIGSARDGTVRNFIEPHPSDREQDGGHGTMGEGVAVDAAGNIFVGEVSLSGMTMFMRQGTMMSH